jgi:2-octaprenyl-6-methoxyphenol hydroxylase
VIVSHWTQSSESRIEGAVAIKGCMETDIAVVGAGPSGLATALALAHAGASVALVGPAPSQQASGGLDTRTAALLDSSVGMLKALGVWEPLAPHAAPLKAIRIIDAAGGILRSPDIEFSAHELGLEAFGYNIANPALVEGLYAKAQSAVHALLPASVEAIELLPDRAVLRLRDGRSLTARLVAGADGRHSVCRKAAAIGVSERSTDQAAVAASFEHELPHRGVSIELHKSGGSVTTVPLTDPRASSLIWIGERDEIDGLMRLDATGFGAALAARLDGRLGTLGAVGARTNFPVAPLSADSLIGPRTALVGEAAHILPPIGAQGLNLGLRDAATLADCVADALQRGGDPGGDSVLAAYDRARRVDVLTRTVGIELLSASLLSGFLPLKAARGLISHGLNALPALRRLVMRVGMAPPTELPSLMRAERSGLRASP